MFSFSPHLGFCLFGIWIVGNHVKKKDVVYVSGNLICFCNGPFMNLILCI